MNQIWLNCNQTQNFNLFHKRWHCEEGKSVLAKECTRLVCRLSEQHLSVVWKTIINLQEKLWPKVSCIVPQIHLGGEKSPLLKKKSVKACKKGIAFDTHYHRWNIHKSHGNQVNQRFSLYSSALDKKMEKSSSKLDAATFRSHHWSINNHLEQALILQQVYTIFGSRCSIKGFSHKGKRDEIKQTCL